MSAVAHIDDYKTGKFYTDEFRGDMSWNGYEANNLLRNEGCDEDGVPRFSDVALALAADREGDARGIAVADFDNDGDLDIAINFNPGDNEMAERRRAAFLRNRIGENRSWLAVELRGTVSNRDAVGAEVAVETGDRRQFQQVTAGSSYASQNSQRLYFGLGESSQVDRLTVRWPSGLVEEFDSLAARQLVELVEGEGMRLSSLPRPADRERLAVQPAPRTEAP